MVPDKKGAITLSKKITTVNDTIFYLGKVWGENVGQVVVTKQFATLALAREKLVAYIDNALIEVGTMPDIGGSEDLRKTELDFLRFEKQMFTNVRSIERFNETTSDEELLKTLADLRVVSRHETDMLTAIQVLQQEYAAKNSIQTASLKNSTK